MTLKQNLDKLRQLVSKWKKDKEYIHILYGDAWEVQFHTTKGIITETHPTDLNYPVEKVLEKVIKLKSL
jgi:hypothetical protein